jgi:hypothetical protein
VPYFLAQSTSLEPGAVREANEAAGLCALPEQPVARSDLLEVGAGNVEIVIESEAGEAHRCRGEKG